MEVFINELSLNEQYRDIEEFSKAVIVFTGAVLRLNKSKCKYVFLKKGDFFFYRKAIENEEFRSSFSKIKDKTLKISFKKIVFDRNNPKNWIEEQVHSSDDSFISETLGENVTGQTLAEISERKTQNSENKYLLLNFQNSAFSGISTTKITKNEELSNIIDCVDSVNDIHLWIEKKCYSKPIVEDSSNFERTSKNIKGATIYKDKATGRYWYLDTFHKNHYEVYNSRKEHLGEADLNGNLDTSKKDKSKNGNIDI